LKKGCWRPQATWPFGPGQHLASLATGCSKSGQSIDGGCGGAEGGWGCFQVTLALERRGDRFSALSDFATGALLLTVNLVKQSTEEAIAVAYPRLFSRLSDGIIVCADATVTKIKSYR
jgi:hypothetical protein